MRFCKNKLVTNGLGSRRRTKGGRTCRVHRMTQKRYSARLSGVVVGQDFVAQRVGQ